MQIFPRRWTPVDKVEFLQRKVLINSIIYYNRDTNLMSDLKFDELCKQLVELQKQVDVKDTMYGYVFYDFVGNTGFDLYHKLTEHDQKYLDNIVTHILTADKKSVKIKSHKGGTLF